MTTTNEISITTKLLLATVLTVVLFWSSCRQLSDAAQVTQLRLRMEQVSDLANATIAHVDELEHQLANVTVELANANQHLEELDQWAHPPVRVHLIHTSAESDFGIVQKRGVQSIFYTNPHAEVIIHALYMTVAPFQFLIDAGYNLKVEKYDIKALVTRLRDSTPKLEHIEQMNNFIEKVDEYRETNAGGYFKVVEADILRLLFLYFDGGIYLDTDMISVKQLDSLPANFLAYENGETINNAYMGFEAGATFVRACLDEAFGNLRLGKWGWQGPSLVSRVHEQKEWDEVAVLGPEYFQYFFWKKVKRDCYEEQDPNKVEKYLTGIRDKAYAVHLNNHATHGLVPAPGSVCECLYEMFCLSTNECSSPVPEHCKILAANTN